MVRRGIRFICRSSHGGSSLHIVPAKARRHQQKQHHLIIEASSSEEVPTPWEAAQPPHSSNVQVLATNTVLPVKFAPEGRAGGVGMLVGWPVLAAVPLAHVRRCHPLIPAVASPVQLC